MDVSLFGGKVAPLCWPALSVTSGGSWIARAVRPTLRCAASGWQRAVPLLRNVPRAAPARRAADDTSDYNGIGDQPVIKIQVSIKLPGRPPCNASSRAVPVRVVPKRLAKFISELD